MNRTTLPVRPSDVRKEVSNASGTRAHAEVGRRSSSSRILYRAGELPCFESAPGLQHRFNRARTQIQPMEPRKYPA